jgi:hypothetical protein
VKKFDKKLKMFMSLKNINDIFKKHSLIQTKFIDYGSVCGV